MRTTVHLYTLPFYRFWLGWLVGLFLSLWFLFGFLVFRGSIALCVCVCVGVFVWALWWLVSFSKIKD